MEDKFITALAEALDMEENEIKMENKFREYETYDSLSELSILAMLDSDFDIELEMEEYNKYITVEDLYKRVSSTK